MGRYQVAPCCLAIVAVFSPHSRAIGEALLDKVEGGVVTVYPIDDLTHGKDDVAKQIDSVLRESNSPELWTNMGGTAAASRVTSQQLTIKAPAELQQSIAMTLDKIREAHNIHFRCEYRVVDTTTLPLSPSAEEIKDVAAEDAAPVPGRVTPTDRYFKVVDPENLPANMATVLAISEVTTLNGDDSLWIDGEGLSLPTVKANVVMWSDRRGVMVTFNFEEIKSRQTKRVRKSVAFSDTAAVALDKDNKRWLLFRVSQVKKVWKPVDAALTPPTNAG